MHRLNYKLLFLILTGFLVVQNKPIHPTRNIESNKDEENQKILGTENNLFKTKKRIKILRKNYDDFRNIINSQGENFIQFSEILGNILISQEGLNQSLLSNDLIEIEADNQYLENNVFYAEGNVILFLPYGTLKADKISYDKNKKIIKAFDRITFQTGNQFLKAKYIEYDLINKDGYITNVFGILDFKSLNNDLNFGNALIERENCPNKKTDIINLPAEVGLLSSNNKRFKNQIGSNSVKFDFSSITKWRFKTDKITLKNNRWNSDIVDFTNDPYNDPQFVLRSKNFIGQIEKGKTKFISTSTFIKFEDKFTLPIGNRTISDEYVDLRWGIGYSTTDKDGLYISRNLDSINLGKSFTYELQPYMLIQRTFQGNSNSFREKGSNVTSDNVKKDISFLDYFSLNGKLVGKFFDFNVEANSYLKTLNPDNLYDGFSSSIYLTRNLLNLNNIDNKSSYNCPVDQKNKLIDNFSLEIGSYAIFDKDDIYTAYGGKLISSYLYKNSDISKNYSLIIDLGKFQGESSSDNFQLLGMSRYGLNASFRHDYKIYRLRNNLISENSKLNNTSEIINQGLYLKTKIASGLYEYDNGTSQSNFTFAIGPSYVYGNLKKNIFDYTEISVIPEFVLKKGQSPFVFDDFNNDSRVRLKIKQQFFGPLIIGFQSDFNINNESNSYGEFENNIFSIQISRRAYSVGLNYSENDKSVLLGFEIFSFGDKQFKDDF